MFLYYTYIVVSPGFTKGRDACCWDSRGHLEADAAVELRRGGTLLCMGCQDAAGVIQVELVGLLVQDPRQAPQAALQVCLAQRQDAPALPSSACQSTSTHTHTLGSWQSLRLIPFSYTNISLNICRTAHESYFLLQTTIIHALLEMASSCEKAAK